jgi:hypothetical protein
MRKSNPPMVFTEGTEAAAKAASAPIVGLRFRLAIPWRVALLQSSLPLRFLVFHSRGSLQEYRREGWDVPEGLWPAQKS